MDYIDGTDAAQLIQQRYPEGMPAQLAIPIITAVASALDYAHRKGLVHRDVSPPALSLPTSTAMISRFSYPTLASPDHSTTSAASPRPI
jgi:serine/threonine protein kinase